MNDVTGVPPQQSLRKIWFWPLILGGMVLVFLSVEFILRLLDFFRVSALSVLSDFLRGSGALGLILYLALIFFLFVLRSYRRTPITIRSEVLNKVLWFSLFLFALFAFDFFTTMMLVLDSWLTEWWRQKGF